MDNTEYLDQAVGRVETTIGELIEAITQVALEAGHSKEESYTLASLTIENITSRDVSQSRIGKVRKHQRSVTR